MSMRRAVFLDRDGTPNEDRDFLREPAEVQSIPGVIESLKRLAHRYLLFPVTNQTGVGYGAITMSEVDTLNRHLLEIFAARGVDMAGVFVCPHTRKDGCACIEPRPCFLEKATRDYALDLYSSSVIGDHSHDVDFARNAGVCGVYVLTGHGVKPRNELTDDTLIFPGIEEAAEWIGAKDAVSARSCPASPDTTATKGDGANG